MLSFWSDHSSPSIYRVEFLSLYSLDLDFLSLEAQMNRIVSKERIIRMGKTSKIGRRYKNHNKSLYSVKQLQSGLTRKSWMIRKEQLTTYEKVKRKVTQPIRNFSFLLVWLSIFKKFKSWIVQTTRTIVRSIYIAESKIEKIKLYFWPPYGSSWLFRFRYISIAPTKTVIGKPIDKNRWLRLVSVFARATCWAYS